MTAEDRLRSRLRSTAASMPVGSGSLADVQARAAQLQRRRNAVRGGAGAFALIAVAAIGIVSLRDGEIADGESAFSATDAEIAAEDAEVATTAATASAEAMADMTESTPVEMSDDSDFGEIVEASVDVDESSGELAEADEELLETEMAAEDHPDAEQGELDADGQTELLSPSGGDQGGVVFATTVAVVRPPDEAQGDNMRYSFSGGHAVAQAEDGWYAYDGTDWQTLGVPPSLDVVAVDLSGPDRIAILAVVLPQDCAVSHVVGVRTGGEWGFARIDDGTPPTVNSELLDASVRITDTSVEVVRTERLWLFEECADLGESAEPTEDGANLERELAALGEIQRTSWLSAPLEQDFDAHWSRIASGDAPSAALRSSDLRWTPTRSPRRTVAARPLVPARDPDAAASVALHETVILDVATTVEVSDGMAWLRHGDQSWEVCPIPEDAMVEAHGEIGWAGEHLAVVVGKPEQTLFLLERTE